MPVAEPVPVVTVNPSPATVSSHPTSENCKVVPPFAPLAIRGVMAVPAPAPFVLKVRVVAVPPQTLTS